MKIEWDEKKNLYNQRKHGMSFEQARRAFEDPNRIIVKDVTHSISETRLYCIGRIHEGIVMVRYTERGDRVRIFGAGFWRKGRRIYEKTYKEHH